MLTYKAHHCIPPPKNVGDLRTPPRTVTPPYSDDVMRLRGAAVLFWLLPKEDGKRDLRAPPLKNPFKGRVRPLRRLRRHLSLRARLCMVAFLCGGEATRKPPPPTENASIYPSLVGRGWGRGHTGKN